MLQPPAPFGRSAMPSLMSVAAVVMVLLTGVVEAATRKVDQSDCSVPDTYCDIQSAIDAAEDGEFALPFLPAEPAAYLATAGELVLPVLLILGLFTRFSAAGLFIMSAVIQFFVFPEQLHIMWMIIFAMLVGYGGNKISLDYLLLKIKK